MEPSKNLKAKKENLVNFFLQENDPTFVYRHADIIDDYFRTSFERSATGAKLGIAKNPYAIIALGGYGRREQCMHSDIDLLILFEKKIVPEAELLVREMIYPLWDIGFEVGYAMRSISECIKLAADDFEVLTSMLDARIICGVSPTYFKLMETLDKKLILSRRDDLVSWLVETNKKRHEYFGDSAHKLEPNLKEGQGGLRDWHTILWIGRIQFNIRELRDLEFTGFLSHNEVIQFQDSLNFIWNVRSRLHHLLKRKCDQLHMEYQKKLATTLNFKITGGRKAVESFLGSLHERMEFIKQRHNMFLYEHGSGRCLPKKRLKKQIAVGGLEIKNGFLTFASSEAILADPELLMKIFQEGVVKDVPLSAEARRLVWEFLYLADEEFKVSARVRESFERTMLTPPSSFNALNLMLTSGMLAAYIPEFKNVANLIQYDQYHIYPVDSHSVHTVEALQKFGAKGEGERDDDLCQRLYKRLTGKRLLLWAALLHDIGKGADEGRHSEKGAAIAEKLLLEKGFAEKDAEKVVFLVREHLFLVKTATRRDIEDEGTAILCARRIKKVSLLKMLYLLTVADSMSTGPKAWNPWAAALVEELFFKTLNILEQGELASDKTVEKIGEKRDEITEAIRDEYSEDEMEALFLFMSPRYFLRVPSREIITHIGLHRKLPDSGGEFVWTVEKSKKANARQVTLCARDRPGLFSRVAGVFALNGIEVLGAEVYTWRNNIALDIFDVSPPPDIIFEDERWEAVKDDLENAVSGKLDPAEALAERLASDPAAATPSEPWWTDALSVIVDNEHSNFYSIVEIFTYNFPGVLFKITDTLFKCGLDIWISRIATQLDGSVNVFYVRDLDGQKIHGEDRIQAVKKAVFEALSEQ